MRYSEPFLSQIHSFFGIVELIAWIVVLPVGIETGRTAVDERANGTTVVPVGCEVGYGQVGRHATVYPVEEFLLGRSVLAALVRVRALALPHGHCDRVVKNESPDEAEN